MGNKNSSCCQGTHNQEDDKFIKHKYKEKYSNVSKKELKDNQIEKNEEIEEKKSQLQIF